MLADIIETGSERYCVIMQSLVMDQQKPMKKDIKILKIGYNGLGMRGNRSEFVMRCNI